MVEESLRLGGKIDILVNNAGATWGAPTAEHPLEAWNKVVALNLTAAFLVSQAVGKRGMLPAKYGKIVNVASIAGLKGPSPRGPSAMTKPSAHPKTQVAENMSTDQGLRLSNAGRIRLRKPQTCRTRAGASAGRRDTTNIA
jgi:NAD(P)-dependent dehydrogenase (short-subunit alcohol dehydrogenase family)